MEVDACRLVNAGSFQRESVSQIDDVPIVMLEATMIQKNYEVNRMENKVYRDEDVSLDVLKDKVIAVLGYGIQGGPQALCLPY